MGNKRSIAVSRFNKGNAVGAAKLLEGIGENNLFEICNERAIPSSSLKKPSVVNVWRPCSYRCWK
jgi:hypothetical protein